MHLLKVEQAGEKAKHDVARPRNELHMSACHSPICKRTWRPKPEYALLDDDRHFTGERKGLLALGEDAYVPVMPVFCRGQLRACFLIGCRPLLELPQHCVLPFDLAARAFCRRWKRSRPFITVARVVLTVLRRPAKRFLKVLVTLVLRLRRCELRDAGGGLLDRHATTDQDCNKLPSSPRCRSISKVVDVGAIPHLYRGQRRHFSVGCMANPDWRHPRPLWGLWRSARRT